MKSSIVTAKKIANDHLKEYYTGIEFDVDMRVTTFTEFRKLDSMYAMVHKLTGKEWTAFKIFPIRYYNQYNRLLKVKERFMNNSSLTGKQKEIQFKKYVRILKSLFTKINEY